MASHDMNLISKVCDRVLIIESGKARMFTDVEQAVDIYTSLRAA